MIEPSGENVPRIFFAYPSQPPTLAETLLAAVRQIGKSSGFSVHGWKDCRIGGKVIMREICDQIGKADLVCADVTGVNFNVMFELGFAIARDKRVWLTLNDTLEGARENFDRLGLLTTIGWRRSCNSEEVITSFFRDAPFRDLESTLFEQAIRPNLPQARPSSLLYLKSLYETDAGIQITRRVEEFRRKGANVVVDDPRESTIQTLSWYGSQVYASEGVLFHLTGPGREGGDLHSARQALVAGLALGMGKPLLLLAERDLMTPVDYKELVRRYISAEDAAARVEEWFAQVGDTLVRSAAAAQEYGARLKLATELGSLQIGEYIAENEERMLVDSYFVQTTAYREASEGGYRVFVGRRGSGKTANFLKLSADLRASQRNLVCEIRPVGYDFHGVVRLLEKYRDRDAKGYAIESLWKFLLYSELLNAAAGEIVGNGGPGSEEERELVALAEQDPGGRRADFSVRLERCVEALFRTESNGGGVEATRLAISETLHRDKLGRMRALLGGVLASKRRVVILIDNLDKPWERDSNLATLAEFLLGLLVAAGRVPVDFRHEDSRRKQVNLNLVLFLRSDIFQRVLKAAREPDKILHSKLTWEDPEVLARVIEERFVASHGGEVDPADLWRRYFCPTVNGVKTRDYLLSRALPRPRDLIYFVKAAMAGAVNRRHTLVEEGDVLGAEKQYSQYALEALAAENGIPVPGMERILYEFAGCRSVLTEPEVRLLLEQGGVPPEGQDDVLARLCSLAFLGVEVRRGDFRFAEDPPEHARNLTLARKFREDTGTARFKVHPAFWAFLEMPDK
ncbi:MAG: hypothetical protein KGL59_09380 [Acidobacteriota bacterium]|nr:hypothetical protein [Acidobacteriota bacterium]